MGLNAQDMACPGMQDEHVLEVPPVRVKETSKRAER